MICVTGAYDACCHLTFVSTSFDQLHKANTGATLQCWLEGAVAGSPLPQVLDEQVDHDGRNQQVPTILGQKLSCWEGNGKISSQQEVLLGTRL